MIFTPFQLLILIFGTEYAAYCIVSKIVEGVKHCSSVHIWTELIKSGNETKIDEIVNQLNGGDQK